MTSPYYQNGYQKRYAWQWWAGQSGSMPATKAPTSSSLGGVTGRYIGSPQLGMADMLESGYGDPNYEAYPALKKFEKCPARTQRPCALRAKAAAQLAGLGALGDDKILLEPWPQGDWPLVRPAGPEPEAMGLPVWSGLSNNEKVVAVAGLGALAWWLWKRRRRGGRRRNPWRVTTDSRGVTGSLVFTSKERAKEYQNYLRRAYEGKKSAMGPYRGKRRRRKRR